jgi:hypothetical protein
VKCTIPVVTNSVISRAINAGVKTGECFEISLSDYGIDFIGRRRTKSFVREWWHCFEDETRRELRRVSGGNLTDEPSSKQHE